MAMPRSCSCRSSRVARACPFVSLVASLGLAHIWISRCIPEAPDSDWTHPCCLRLIDKDIPVEWWALERAFIALESLTPGIREQDLARRRSCSGLGLVPRPGDASVDWNEPFLLELALGVGGWILPGAEKYTPCSFAT